MSSVWCCKLSNCCNNCVKIPMAENTQQCVRDDVNVCQLCGDLENLLVCGACKGAWYCSKSHQKEHWKTHKLICKKRVKHSVSAIISDRENLNLVNRENNNETMKNKELEVESTDPAVSLSSNNVSTENVKYDMSNMTDPVCNYELSEKAKDGSPSKSKSKITTSNKDVKDTEDELQVPLSTKSYQPETDIKQKIFARAALSNNGQQQRYYLNQSTQVLDLPPSISELSKNRQDSSKPDSISKEDNFSSVGSKDQFLLILQSRFAEVSKYVVKCLTQYGICVVDKFLGDATCQEIFKEVLQLKSSGLMNQGQLVNGPSSSSKNKHIRGDIITWVDGGEYQCENIHYLISCMDTVMLQVAKSLENCNINERTKAMVACYPGKGRGYIRHIDNPNGDGRCVTSIYYLNKNWDFRNDGGLLRIYPLKSDQVANIEPICDRLLFFWSDKRNPHEVERALRERFAITVWYYDANERAEALKRLKEGTVSASN